MTDQLRQAAQQALEALEHHSAIKHPQQIHYRDTAIAALKAALEQQAEPPQRQWQGLTDEDYKGISSGDQVVAMWAERILKERNT